MKKESLEHYAGLFLGQLESIVKKFLEDVNEFEISQGHWAVVILGPDGTFFGRVRGESKIKGRDSLAMAFKKASQVWLTGMETGEFERRVYAGEIDWAAYGIMKPDFVGWEGGLPVQLEDGTLLSIGLSGMRAETDAAVVRLAARQTAALFAPLPSLGGSSV